MDVPAAARRAGDRFTASDPGLTRLRGAVSTAVAIATVLGVEYGLALFTRLAQQQTVLAMMLGAVVAMSGTPALAGSRAWPKVRTAACFPLAVGLGMVLGALTATNTLLMLAVFVAVMFVAVYVRRFGVTFFFLGFMIWIGYFFAALLHAGFAQLPSSLVAVVVASAWLLLLSLTVLKTKPAKVLARTRRAFGVRAKAVAQASRRLRRVRAAQNRLAEAALMIEGWSGELPGGASAAALRRLVLDAQLAVDDLVAGAEGLRGGDAELVLAAARVAGIAGGDGFPAAAPAAAELLTLVGPAGAHRAGGWAAARQLATAVGDYAELMREADSPSAITDEFEPVVTLSMGNLPGSVSVARDVRPRGGP